MFCPNVPTCCAFFSPTYPVVEDMSNFQEIGCSTFRKAEDLMFHLRKGIGCSAVLRHPGASAQHCTGMTNWPNTIQCFGWDQVFGFPGG